MPLPVVTPRDLNLVRLSPQARRILRHRANAAARREYAPVLAADRAAFAAANRAYGQAASGARGATSTVENILGRALRQTRGSGLQGGYLKQVLHEIAARQGDAAQALPFLLSDAAQTRQSAILDAQQQLLGDRADMRSGAASSFNQLLKEARTSGASELKSRRSEKGSGSSDLRQGVKAALTEVRRLLAAYPGQSPDNEKQWARFTGEVAKAEGVSGVEAAIAVRLFLQKATASTYAGAKGHAFIGG